MIGQSVINVQSGDGRRSSGIISGLFILLMILVAGPAIDLLPLASLTGVMFMVVINTFYWKTFDIIINFKLPIPEIIAIIIVAITVIFTNIAVAVAVGIIWAAVVYSWESGNQLWLNPYFLPEDPNEKPIEIDLSKNHPGTLEHHARNEEIELPRLDPDPTSADYPAPSQESGSESGNGEDSRSSKTSNSFSESKSRTKSATESSRKRSRSSNSQQSDESENSQNSSETETHSQTESYSQTVQKRPSKQEQSEDAEYSSRIEILRESSRSSPEEEVGIIYIPVGAIKVYEIRGSLTFSTLRTFGKLFKPSEDPDDIVLDFKYGTIFVSSKLSQLLNISF